MSCVFLFGFAPVEDDSLLSGQEDESVPSESSCKGDARLSSEIDTPSGES